MEKIKIGISSCLLGEKVRYNGDLKLDSYITDILGKYFEWIPVCPETEYGLPVPREPMRLVGQADSPRLLTVRTGSDHTEGMLKWTDNRLMELESRGLCGFIFKSKSPSCGLKSAKIYNSSGKGMKKGAGFFAGAFMKHFPCIPAAEEEFLSDPDIRGNFIERIFVYKRWQDFIAHGGKLKDLLDFHAEHKLLVMSHSPKYAKNLGNLSANRDNYAPEELAEKYINILSDALKLPATVKNHTNVLQHIAGYFKKKLSPAQKQELKETIECYLRGQIPLTAPVELINLYVRLYDEPYLKRQVYLNPHPIELITRNQK